jgi:hypothetical protein
VAAAPLAAAAAWTVVVLGWRRLYARLRCSWDPTRRRPFASRGTPTACSSARAWGTSALTVGGIT